MTIPEISKIISQGEGISVEFKEAREKVPASFYETVVSFANTNGGTILLGVDDDGNATGVNPDNKAKYLKNIVTALNSADKINPVLNLNPTAIDYNGKLIIAVQVQPTSQVHDHAGRIYIRKNEVDIDVTGNQHEIRGLFMKKGNIYTENQIYPSLKMSDMDETLFDKARNLIRSNKYKHPWLAVDNMQMLADAMLYSKAHGQQIEEGFTLAAALLFGKDHTIQSLLPAYKVEAMVRIKNKDRWDDRLTLRTNLIDTYQQLTGFINRHLPDKFFMEGDQRIDLRDKIFREVIGNIIVHREYTDATATELIIEEDAVRTINPNNPRFNGIMDLDSFNPHPKNPNLRRFFVALGWADEIGSGIRNTKKYLPFYVENAKPVFIDEPMFRTVIPLVRYTMADNVNKWLNWLNLDEKLMTKLTESLKNIEIDGHLHKMGWNEQLEYFIPNWIENDNKIALSSAKKSPKSKKTDVNENQIKDNCYNSSQVEKSPKSNEKINKKLNYLVKILFMTGSPMSIDEMMLIFEYRDYKNFRMNFINLLEKNDLITKTNPDKPTASNQKYIITEKGKQFLTK